MTRALRPVLLVLVIIVAACGDDAGGDEGGTEIATETVGTPEYLAFRDQPTACGAEVPLPAQSMSFEAPADVGVGGSVTATIATSCGDITIELDPAAAPATVNSFVFLAESGYFDGTVSHRVIPGFVVQLGDPTATGRGGPGYLLPDELPGAGFVYSRGTLAMANAGPNTGGSQFFLMLDDAPLPPAYSVFGTITEGIEVLDLIAQVPTVARSAGQEPSSPTETIYIESIDIQR
jgi:cyclophilin family peptidyl-prolyl cis-trans isomerase